MTANNTTHAKAQEMSCELTPGTLDNIVGGTGLKAESQIMQTLSSMVNEVIKNFSSSLAATARG